MVPVPSGGSLLLSPILFTVRRNQEPLVLLSSCYFTSRDQAESSTASTDSSIAYEKFTVYSESTLRSSPVRNFHILGLQDYDPRKLLRLGRIWRHERCACSWVMLHIDSWVVFRIRRAAKLQNKEQSETNYILLLVPSLSQGLSYVIRNGSENIEAVDWNRQSLGQAALTHVYISMCWSPEISPRTVKWTKAPQWCGVLPSASSSVSYPSPLHQRKLSIRCWRDIKDVPWCLLRSAHSTDEDKWQ